MIYSHTARPIRVLRLATPADVVDIGKSDPGVYRASRSPGRVTLVVEDIETGERLLVNQGQMARFQPDGGAALAERMNEILGSREGG